MNDVPTHRSPRIPAPGRYDIRLAGHLAPRWVTWFDGMTLTQQDDGTTVISGPVADQSALHGLLRKLSDLGLTLVSVTPQVDEPAKSHSTDGNDSTVQAPPTTRSST